MFKILWLSSLTNYIITFLLIIAVLIIQPLFTLADINNDRYDGNIFVVYAGNGSLVPPKLTLKQSFDRKLPVILVYYLDDNSDSKQFAFIVSRLQEFYGKVASIIPVNVDTIPVKDKYKLDEVGYYYQGEIPQTVILDENRKIVYNGIGVVEFEEMDDVLRAVFDLLPRSESVELKRKTFNEFNSELVPEEKKQ